MSNTADSTLDLARRLRELADGLNEAELRSALSRSYYSVFHAARVLGRVGPGKKVTQGNVVEVMSDFDQHLGASIRELRNTRHKADYDENYVERDFGGDLEIFRSEVRKLLDQGLLAYRRIVTEIQQRRSNGN